MSFDECDKRKTLACLLVFQIVTSNDTAMHNHSLNDITEEMDRGAR